MKNFLHLTLLLALWMVNQHLDAQVTIFDFESSETSTNFVYFGSSLDGSPASIIANPAPDAVNETDSVIRYIKPADAQTWAGAFASPAPPDGIDAIAGGQICVDVWMDHIGNLALKLEQSSTGADWVITIENETTGAWEEICFDLSENSIEEPFEPAAGHFYSQIVLFPDFGMAGNDDTTYIDEIILHPGSAYNVTTYYDQETDSTSGVFQYFGSSLDGSLTSTAANPAPDTVNGSANVIKYVKPADAQTWAGAFANPAPEVPVDATNGGMMCIDVYFDHMGAMTFKLEQSPSGGADWVYTIPNTVVNGWETLCFPFDSASVEDPFTSATGHVYNMMVIFPDLGTPGNGVDSVVYYLDNFVQMSPAGTSVVDVDFNVDMSDYSESFTNVYVSGTFNDWCGECDRLEDPDGDGIYTGTVAIPQGNYEYKFTLDNWAVQEQFDGTETCVVTDPSGQFTNRNLLVTPDYVADTVCFNSCYACDERVYLTVHLNTALLDSVSSSGIYIAGGAEFGHGDYELTDPDGDGVYSIVLERYVGFTSDYTFINGICLPNWECKENIAGQSCAVPPFNDRHLPAMTDDVTINTCFGACTDDGSCPDPEQEYEVTFRVDMSGETVSGGVYLAGNTINGWDPTATPMDDSDGDEIYEAAVMLQEGIHEYKYINADVWEELTQGDPCTVTDMSGEFTNRLLLLSPGDTTLPAYLFESCDLSTASRDIFIDESLFDLYPSPASNFCTLNWDGTELEVESIELVNAAGMEIMKIEPESGQTYYRFDLTALQGGMYSVILRSRDKIGVKKLILL